jgi:phosphatidylglycerol:prolipoprotein diacylglycerol transferase
MFPVLNIGPLSIQTPGLIILIGIWLGLALSERLATTEKFNKIYNLVLISIIFGVIGGRLGYVLEHPQAFLDNPINIFSLNPDMFNLFAGIGAGLIAAIIYGQRKNMLLWKTLDSLTPFFAVLFIAVGASHLASGEAFGSPSDLPWSIYLWGTNRHPAQVYEIMLGTFILIFVIIWSRRKTHRADGILFLTFLALSALVRLFTEAFRGDSILTIFGIRTAQLIAWIVLAISLWALGKRFSRDQITTENHINSKLKD